MGRIDLKNSDRMFDSYDNLPHSYIPCNLNPVICGEDKYYATIVRGTTPRHSFELPFDLVRSLGSRDGEVLKLRITYMQGLETILEKTEADIEALENDIILDDETDYSDDECLIYYTLTEEETYRFKVTNPTNIVKVQIKVYLVSGEVLVTPIFDMKVIDSLNQENFKEEEN